MARPPKDRPDVEVFNQISLIHQLVGKQLESVLPEGLSRPQFGVLARLARHHEVTTPAELARAFQVTKGAITNTLQRLEQLGFIAVEADPSDGRRKLISITPAGSAAYDAALKAMRPINGSLRSAFTDGEFIEALPFLNALRVWLEEGRE